MKDYITNTKGHEWKLDEDDGEVDIFALDYDIHNGPMCINCGYSFCHHCDKEPLEYCTLK